MQYLSGIKDRERYNDFLSQKYDPNEFVAFSTNYNLTIESLESRFQGLYNQELKQSFEIKLDETKEEAYPPIGDIAGLSPSLSIAITNLKKDSLFKVYSNSILFCNI